MRVHPLVLLSAFVVLASVLTFVVPAGQFERRDDAAIGRKVVVPGSYHVVAPSPVGPFDTLMAVPKGLADASSVVFLVLIAGGAFSVVDKTGALHHGVRWLAARLQNREALVIPIACVVFGAGGAVEGMWEELVALVPVLILLVGRVGYDPLTAVAMSLGAAGIGGTFSPMNPFGVGIAQKFAELPLMSGWQFRLVVLVLALAIWTWGTMWHATRHRIAPTHDPLEVAHGLEPRHVAALLGVVGAFTLFVIGAVRYEWGFDQLTAIFLLMAIGVGLVGRLRVTDTAEAFVAGLQSTAYAGVMIGVARAIFVVLDEGRIVDTLINAMVTPLAHLPVTLFAAGIAVVQSAIALPVPSSSGRVVLTMPILVPLSDLLGLSRQVTVMATQYGPGVLGQILPTDGALMAILALAGVRYDQWLRFCAPLCLALFALGLAAVAVAVAVNLQ